MKYLILILLSICFWAPSSQAVLKGKVNNVTVKNSQLRINGWACKVGQEVPVEVKFFVHDDKMDGEFSGFPVGSIVADKVSGKDVQKACEKGKKHNFIAVYPIFRFQSMSLQKIMAYAVDSGLTGKLTDPTQPNTNQLPNFENYTCGGAKNQDRCVFPLKSKSNTEEVLSDNGDEWHSPDSQFFNLSTHEITSHGVVLGVNAYGGGYITKLSIPGLGDIVAGHSAKYGRGGQSSIRDSLHGNRYNPTQAGFTDPAGTQVRISLSKNKRMMTIHPRYLVGYSGDREYDYTNSNNLADDHYPETGDWDGVVEENLNQSREVTTEFDFYGTYERCRPSIKTPCFIHYYEYRFVRGTSESHFIKQFFDGFLKDGSPILNEAFLGQKITENADGSIIESTKHDLAKITSKWTLRFDNLKFDPYHRFYVSQSDSQLQLEHSDRLDGIKKAKLGSNYLNGFLIADSDNPATGTAIGVFKPRSSRINGNQVVTRKFSSSNNLKIENRRTGDDRSDIYIQDVPQRLGKAKRIDDMSLFGFTETLDGLVNPDNLNSNKQKIGNRKYETLRAEVYLLVGTPNEILEAVSKLKFN